MGYGPLEKHRWVLTRCRRSSACCYKLPIRIFILAPCKVISLSYFLWLRSIIEKPESKVQDGIRPQVSFFPQSSKFKWHMPKIGLSMKSPVPPTKFKACPYRLQVITELDQFADSPKPHTSDYLILQKSLWVENIICSKDIEGPEIKEI